jgi:hypothetical protein
MYKRLFFPFTGVIFLVCTSCIGFGPSIKGNGKVVKEERRVSNFAGIRVSAGMNVYISQDSVQKVVVEADENLLEAIETRIEDNNLIITVTENIREAKSKKVLVSVHDLNEISAIAGSIVFIEDAFRSEDLKVSSVAGSSLNLNLITNSLVAKAVAGSNILLKGISDKAELKATAGANIKAKDLKAQTGIAKANSGSNIWLTVVNEIDANANTGGNIYFYGNPATKYVKNSSGGNTIHR